MSQLFGSDFVKILSMDAIIGKKNKYQILRLLEESSNSRVLLAKRINIDMDLWGEVVLKIPKNNSIKQDLTLESGIQAMQPEKNLLGIHDIDICVATKSPFYVMPYVEGCDLKSIGSSMKLSEDECIYIICSVFRGLMGLHQQGKLHGDLSPRNIMIDKRGEVFVIDYGYSNVGLNLGTPEFCSPKRVHGGPATRESDLFSLYKIADWLGLSSTSRLQAILQCWKEEKRSPSILIPLIEPSIKLRLGQKVEEEWRSQLPGQTCSLGSRDHYQRDRGRVFLNAIKIFIVCLISGLMPHGSAVGSARWVQIKTYQRVQRSLDGERWVWSRGELFDVQPSQKTLYIRVKNKVVMFALEDKQQIIIKDKDLDQNIR